MSVDTAGNQANGQCFGAGITADGSKIPFSSDATNLVSGDTNNTSDVFLRDLAAGTTQRVSLTNAGAQSNGYSYEPAISRDGALVMFASTATNLVANDKNNRQDVFVRDLVAGTTGRVSNGANGVESNGDAYAYSMAGDGLSLVWWSYADNLVSGDTNNVPDVFLRDRVAATTTRLSVSEAGVQGDSSSTDPHFSANGSNVVFTTSARNLAGIETNNNADVLVFDRTAATLRKVSVHVTGEEGASGSFGHAVSDDGLTVAMMNWSSDLIGSDANGIHDLLTRDRSVADPEASWQNYGAGWPGALGVPTLTASADPIMGTTIDALIGNSVGFYTVGFLYLGVQAISIPTKLGGTLLVDPISTTVFLVDLNGSTISGDIPLDDTLAGLSIYAQVLELDNAASKGVSFTPGLELVLGQ